MVETRQGLLTSEEQTEILGFLNRRRMESGTVCDSCGSVVYGFVLSRTSAFIGLDGRLFGRWVTVGCECGRRDTFALDVLQQGIDESRC